MLPRVDHNTGQPVRQVAQVSQRRQAWKGGNLELVLKCLKDIRSLLGVDAPVKQDVSHAVHFDMDEWKAMRETRRAEIDAILDPEEHEVSDGES